VGSLLMRCDTASLGD